MKSSDSAKTDISHSIGRGKDKQITVLKVNDEDYLSLTDMLKAKDGDFFITDWLRNRNTLEYIGIWEQVYRPD